MFISEFTLMLATEFTPVLTTEYESMTSVSINILNTCPSRRNSGIEPSKVRCQASIFLTPELRRLSKRRVGECRCPSAQP